MPEFTSVGEWADRYRQRDKWFNINLVTNEKAEIFIYDVIDPFFGFGAQDLIRELREFDNVEEIVVAINSPGGSVKDGIAIYNLLANHAAVVTTRIDFAAYSIASVIALAGDSVQIAENGLFMIHDPSTFSFGTAEDLRRDAEVLDVHKDVILQTYVRKTGIDRQELSQLMSDETWFTAEEALDRGFVDEIVSPFEESEAEDEAQNCFDLTKFGFVNVPECLKPKEVNKMPKTAEVNNGGGVAPAGGDNPKAEPKVVTAPTAGVPAANETADYKDEINARNAEINKIFAPYAVQYADLKNQVLSDVTISVDNAREMLLDAIGAQSTPAQTQPVIQVGADLHDVKNLAADAIAMRCGVGEYDSHNPFNNASLLEISKECLNKAGISHYHMSKHALVQNALTHSTSDFPGLLQNTVNKILQERYSEVTETWSRWCDITSVPDFKVNSRIRLGSFSNMRLKLEGAEYQAGTLGEERETIQAQTVGRMITFTRESIINDDLNGLSRTASMMGMAAGRAVSNDVYSLLAQNPATSDTHNLFSVEHNNFAASGGVVDIDTLDAGRQAMKTQRGPANGEDEDLQDFIDATPRYLLVGVGQYTRAKTIIRSSTHPSNGRNNREPNPLMDFVEIIEEPRIPNNAWYLVTDPNNIPLIEVAFLDGVRSPELESQEAFKTDGIAWKVRMDYGVAPNDYRGGYFNPGA